MTLPKFVRIPKHIGVIPDGNRRWALSNGLGKHEGYHHGIGPGFELYNLCLELGIKELTLYGFTQDNTKRPSIQTEYFRKACVDAVRTLSNRDAELLVIGNHESPMFPEELLPFIKRVKFGEGKIKVNFLVNYDWNWDIEHSNQSASSNSKGTLLNRIASSDISRIDMVIRWGGRRRLSGFLPVQSVYADFFVLDEMWPDFSPNHLFKALDWYQQQDVTLGG